MSKPINLRDRAASLRAVAPERKSATPPEDNGVILGTLDRGDAELRVVFAEFKGHPYINLRLWKRDNQGQAWPSREGVTVRLHELPMFLELMDSAAEMAQHHFDAARAR